MTGSEDRGPGVPEGLNRDTFARFAEPHRRELKLHCYRMLGSLQDAEDAVQETFVKAWNALDEFEGRALFKNWLYRIATNACLNALASRSRRSRLLPAQLAGPTRELPTGQFDTEVPWLEPYPDFELERIADTTEGPERRYETREAVRLAFMAAIQQLPPRQRAALILSDVIGWSTAEVAALLGGSAASVNSLMQRARETMQRSYGSEALASSAKGGGAEPQALLDRYVHAWESTDVDAFVKVLKEDATYSMPPYRQWYHGRAAIRAFFAYVWKAYGGFRLVPIHANSQPAFALYSRSKEGGEWKAHSLQVLSVESDGVAAITMFMKPLALTIFPAFHLPLTLQD